MKKLFTSFGILILAGIFFFSSAVTAQTTPKQLTDGTEKIALKLQQKVLLTDEQTTKVKSIISAYFDSDKSPDNLAEAQKKIETILDPKQKAKYDIIKADWWKSVNKGTK